MDFTNHQVISLITKGNLDNAMSLITKGILTTFYYEIVPIEGRKKRGSGGQLYGDIEKFGIDEIDYINVYVDWYKHKGNEEDKKSV